MRAALEGLPGVAKGVEVDFAAQTATCTVDPKKFDAKNATAVLAKDGYEISEVVKDHPKKEDTSAEKE